MSWFKLPFHIDSFYYLLCVAIVFVVLIVMRLFGKRWSRSIALAMTLSYLFLILSITVFTRNHVDLATFDLDSNVLPMFWVYREILRNESRRTELIAQIIMNMLMLAPLGFMIPFITKKYPVLIGIGCSILIELIQLITERGYFEIDDILHNSLGVVLGYLINKMIMTIYITQGRKRGKQK